MMRDAWDSRQVEAEAAKAEILQSLTEVERQIETLLDRIVATSRASVARALENRLETLERKKGLPIREGGERGAAEGTDGLRIVSNSRCDFWQVLGISIVRGISLRAEQCFGFCLRSRCDTLKMACIELPYFPSLFRC